jgi:MYXO-CTERM domain-containing protein
LELPASSDDDIAPTTVQMMTTAAEVAWIAHHQQQSRCRNFNTPGTRPTGWPGIVACVFTASAAVDGTTLQRYLFQSIAALDAGVMLVAGRQVGTTRGGARSGWTRPLGSVVLLAAAGLAGCGSESDGEFGGSPRAFLRTTDAWEGAALEWSTPAHGFSARFDANGVVLTDAHDSPKWQLLVVVDGFGCSDTLTRVSGDTPIATANRIDQGHGALDAWYLNGPVGIEQGFDILVAPPCLVDEPTLTIAMTIDGLDMALGPLGDVAMLDLMGEPVLSVDGLKVRDAAGDRLPAAFRAEEGRLFIDIDAAGATFPIQVDPLWSQVQKLTASDLYTSAAFGSDVAISGDTGVVGAPVVDSKGAVYVFSQSGISWSQQAKLIASDGAIADQLGRKVSIDGDTVVAGAPFDDGVGTNSGSVYVFTRSGTIWAEQAKLTAADAAAGDEFGHAVAVSGNTALVGARGNDDAGANSGSAYVFVRTGTVWSQQAKLTASNAAAGQVFGVAVALEGDTAIIGAYLADAPLADSGAVYVFQRSGTSWSESAILTAFDAAAGDRFGRAVAISGNTVMVGAPADDDVASFSGSVYEFVSSGGFWFTGAKLTATNPSADDQFGSALSVAGNKAVVGASLKDVVGSNSGAAYPFTRSGSVWLPDPMLAPNDGATLDHFGHSVCVSNNVVMIGANQDDIGASPAAGSTYVFMAGAPLGTPCNGDAECALGFCRDGVCCNADCGAGVPSDCQSCLAAQTPQSVNGTCDIILAAAAYTCRVGSGDFCDPAEICNGNNPSCPNDVLAPPGTVCAVGSGDMCDAPAVCSGVSGQPCPTGGLAPSGTVCRSGSGDACDPTEACTGVSGQPCPPDVVSSNNTVCRAGSGDGCDSDESCTGIAGQACPPDVVASANTTCRPGSGDVCDPDEVCTGIAGQSCPPDAVALASTVCRTGSGDTCDPDENCTGQLVQPCPPDVVSADGDMCGGGVCEAGICQPSAGGAGGQGADGGAPPSIGDGGAGNGTGGAGGTGGADGGAFTVDDAGCGCRVVAHESSKRHGWALALGLAAALMRRRRRSARCDGARWV